MPLEGGAWEHAPQKLGHFRLEKKNCTVNILEKFRTDKRKCIGNCALYCAGLYAENFVLQMGGGGGGRTWGILKRGGGAQLQKWNVKKLVW